MSVKPLRLPDAQRNYNQADESTTRRLIEQAIQGAALVPGPIAVDPSQFTTGLTLSGTPSGYLVYTLPDGSTAYMAMYPKV